MRKPISIWFLMLVVAALVVSGSLMIATLVEHRPRPSPSQSPSQSPATTHTFTLNGSDGWYPASDGYWAYSVGGRVTCKFFIQACVQQPNAEAKAECVRQWLAILDEEAVRHGCAQGAISPVLVVEEKEPSP